MRILIKIDDEKLKKEGVWWEDTIRQVSELLSTFPYIKKADVCITKMFN